MMGDFDFGSGQYRLIQSFDELVPGQKYLVRVRNPIRDEFILKYRGSDQINLIFDTALYMRRARDNNLWMPPLREYKLKLFRTFSHKNVTFNDNQLFDNNYQIFSLGYDGNFITTKTRPEMLRGILDKIILETYNLCRHNNLPPEIGFEIKGFLTNKIRRTKK
jgi:hypothetical protein